MTRLACAVLVVSSVASADPRVVEAPGLEMARVGPAIVVDAEVVYAIGGENSEGRLRSAEIWDRDHWSALGKMRVRRERHTATLLGDGTILVAGGGFEDPDARLAEQWDSSNFVPAGRMLEVRSRHTATLLPDGRVLVIGGRDLRERPLATAEIWDPKTRTWRAAGRMTTGRCCHTATLLADGRVLVVGGLVPSECLFDAKPPCHASTNTVEIWNPKTQTFSPGPPLTEGEDRAAHTATRLPDGRVLVAGGAPNLNDAGGDEYDLHDALFDPTASTWKRIDGVHRAYHSATLLADGGVLVIGGAKDWCGCCKKAKGSKPFVSTIQRFDPVLEKWFDVGDSLVPRGRHGAALQPDGSVLVIGGESKEWGHTGRPFSSCERWMP